MGASGISVPVKNISVLIIFRQSLKHAERLGEVHWHGDL